MAIPLWYLLGLRRELDAALAATAEQARTDALTGLLNRRGLAERLPAAAAAARVRGDRLAVLCFDLDRFKAVNDTLGHAAGDEVLAVVAGVLREGCRHDDLLVRVGGEELAVLSAVREEAEAVAAAERLRERVGLACRAWGVTTSVGVAVAPPPRDAAGHDAGGSAPAALLRSLQEAADLALYRAKAAGRDRVELAAVR